jgi:hypothetical protein
MADTSLATQSQNQVSFAPTNIEEAFRFADLVLMSGMAPKSYTDIFNNAKAGPEKEAACEKARAAVVIALQLGQEVGFAPMQSLQSIASINGMPTIWGDGALALIKSKGLVEYIKEDDLADITKNSRATCIVKRRGEPNEHTVTFSYDDARKAGIFDRNVWKVYPARMCQCRARAFALRNVFPDVLKGLAIREEVEDFTTIEGNPPPQPKPQGQIKVPTVTAETTLAEVLIPKKDAVAAIEAVEATPVQNEPKPVEAAQENLDAEPAPEDDPEMVKALAEEAKKWATGYFAAYKAAGKTPDESKAFLKKQFNVEDSRQVPVAKRDFAMEQAKVGFPEEKF